MIKVKDLQQELKKGHPRQEIWVVLENVNKREDNHVIPVDKVEVGTGEVYFVISKEMRESMTRVSKKSFRKIFEQKRV